METPKGLWSVVTTVLFHFFFGKRIQRFRDNEKIKDANKKYTSSFKKGFIEPSNEVSYFYGITGFETNSKTIPKYTRFKDRLGGDFTWDHIKRAKSHLCTEGKEIQVNLKKWEKVLCDVFVVLGFLMFILGTGGTFALTEYGNSPSYEKDLFTLFIPILPTLLGVGALFLFVYAVDSIIAARHIEKTLKRRLLK